VIAVHTRKENSARHFVAAWPRSAEWGSPFFEIIRYAREHEIDLMMMGTHRRSGIKHLLMAASQRTSSEAHRRRC
jgi:nucleotide-binding universal stress UspA family protein